MFLFLTDTATTEICTLSLHDALPILVDEGEDDELMHEVEEQRGLTERHQPCHPQASHLGQVVEDRQQDEGHPDDPDHRRSARSEEHTSELQSRRDLVCRLLLEKKNLN